MYHKEYKDKELFERIGHKYSKKDLYPVSMIARKFQILSLMNIIEKEQFNHVLDVGCGPGFNAKYLAGKYQHFTGIDYAKKFIEISKMLHPEARFMTGNIKKLGLFIDEKPDLVLGVGILHHVVDPKEALISIKKICDDNTIIAFVEPNNGNPFIQFLRRIRKKLDTDYNDDQVFFSKKEIIKLVESAGFSVQNFKYQGYFSTPFAQVILKPSILFKPICKFSIYLDKFIQNKINNKFSWNLMITARKSIS